MYNIKKGKIFKAETDVAETYFKITLNFRL